MNYDAFSYFSYIYFTVFFIEYYEIGLFDYWTYESFAPAEINGITPMHIIKHIMQRVYLYSHDILRIYLNIQSRGF